MNDSVVEVRDFPRVYGDFVAVNGISFEVKSAEIFGLAGLACCPMLLDSFYPRRKT